MNKVITGSTLTALLGSKGRIRQNQMIVIHILPNIGKGIPQNNLTVNIMKHGIHQRQTVGIVYQFTTCKSFFPLKPGRICIQIIKFIRVFSHILAGGNHKAECTTGRIITAFTRLGFHQSCHHINQYPRGKILSCSGFLFICILFQQTFIQISKPFFPGGKPIQFIDCRDYFFQIFRLFNVRHRALINLAHSANTMCTEQAQQVFIISVKLQSGFTDQHIPAIGLNHLFLVVQRFLFGCQMIPLHQGNPCGKLAFRFCFFCHFQKQNVSQFRHILVIGNSVIPQNITEIPELGHNFLRSH